MYASSPIPGGREDLLHFRRRNNNLFALFVILRTWVIHFKSFCIYTPRSVKVFALSISIPSVCVGGGSGEDLLFIILLLF